MDWINPDEQLPPPGDDVLVCINANPGRIRTAYYVRGREEWFDFGHRADKTPIEVLGWLPMNILPEPIAIPNAEAQPRRNRVAVLASAAAPCWANL